MDINGIKEANPIEDVIGNEHPLRGGGRRFLRAEEHDSLIVDVYNQAFYWNSKGESGDVITWVMARQNFCFKEAVEWLCRRAGLPDPEWGGQSGTIAVLNRERTEILTVMARELVRMLRESPIALDYCHSRGWTDETIQKAGLGFITEGATQRLRGALSMYKLDGNSDAAKAVLGIREGMLVYPHVERGRVVYLSARSIDPECPKGRAHFNPKADLIGDRQVYLNWVYSSRAEEVVVVEGQADAITLGQWGVPAVALAGVAVNQGILKMLARVKTVFVGLDEDKAGIRAKREMCDALGPLSHWVKWPENDANGWLQVGATAEDCAELLAAAPTWIEVLAEEAGSAENSQRDGMLRRAMAQVSRVDEFSLVTMRDELAEKMGLRLRQFDGLLKATREKEIEEDAPLLLPTPIVGGQIQAENGEDYYLVETVYEPPAGSMAMAAVGGGKTLLAVRDPEGNVETMPYLDVGKTRYLPPPPGAQLLHKRQVAFAPRVGPLLNGSELVQEVQALIHKYIDVSEFMERLASYYVLLTWFYDAFKIVPYLRFRGDWGTGKSRAVKVVGALCFRPMKSSGASSDAALFRMMDTWRGSLLFEEGDLDNSDYAQTKIKILNQGYDADQAFILRCADKARDFETEAFYCFGPKLMAMRGEFEDQALESRCYTEEMQETTRDDIQKHLPSEFWEMEAPDLRSKLLAYRLAHWQPVIEVDENALQVQVAARLVQISLPLFAVIRDEKMREEFREFVRAYHQRDIERLGLTLASKVLEALVVQWALDVHLPERKRDTTMRTICRRTNQLIDFENYGYEQYLIYLGADNKVRDRKVGAVARKQLQLNARRSATFGGRWALEYDDRRMRALMKRYGVSEDRLVDLLEIVQKLDAMEEEDVAKNELVL